MENLLVLFHTVYKFKFYNISVDVILTTQQFGEEISWSLLDQDTCATVCSSEPPGSFASFSMITKTCQLEVNKVYKLHCKDSYGDGWHGGYVTIKGQRYCGGFCPDNSNCYGDGEYPPEGGLFVVRDIRIEEGM